MYIGSSCGFCDEVVDEEALDIVEDTLAELTADDAADDVLPDEAAEDADDETTEEETADEWPPDDAGLDVTCEPLLGVESDDTLTALLTEEVGRDEELLCSGGVMIISGESP